MAAEKGSKYAIGNNGGRPPKYKTVKEIEPKIDAYFEYIKGEFKIKKNRVQVNEKTQIIESKEWTRQPEVPTITGLALFLGFADRSSLYDYKKRDKFSYAIKRALTVIEHYHEKGLSEKSPAGHIFALKNRGWKDKTETEITGIGEGIKIRDWIDLKLSENEK